VVGWLVGMAFTARIYTKRTTTQTSWTSRVVPVAFKSEENCGKYEKNFIYYLHAYRGFDSSKETVGQFQNFY
jgi:hypothetical protein